MRSTVVEGQVSPKGAATGMPLASDLGCGVARGIGSAGGRGGSAFAEPARRAGTFAAAAERATRLLLLSAVGAIEDDPDARSEAEGAEAEVLLDLALCPAASDREHDLKRSLFSGFASRRDDNLRALLDAALDADAARLRDAARSRRVGMGFSAGLAR